MSQGWDDNIFLFRRTTVDGEGNISNPKPNLKTFGGNGLNRPLE